MILRRIELGLWGLCGRTEGLGEKKGGYNITTLSEKGGESDFPIFFILFLFFKNYFINISMDVYKMYICRTFEKVSEHGFFFGGLEGAGVIYYLHNVDILYF